MKQPPIERFMSKIKPDSSQDRLLSNEKLSDLGFHKHHMSTLNFPLLRDIAKAQDAHTAELFGAEIGELKGVLAESVPNEELLRLIQSKNAECRAEIEGVFKKIESCFADGETMTTFIREADKKIGVEECKILITSEWEHLKKENGIK